MVLSLLELTYMACPGSFNGWCDRMTSQIDIRWCCFSIMNPPADDKDTVCTEAARHGHIDCLQMARNRGLGWSVQTAAVAAAKGYLSVLKYLCSEGCPMDSRVPEAAAAAGYVNILRYLNTQGCEPDDNAMTAAARHGRVKCMRFCREVAGVPWTTNQMIAAAAHGRLESIKYAYANGCKPDNAVCVVAAMNGHFEFMKFAHENGCQLTWAVITMTTNEKIREYCQGREIKRSVDACNSCVMKKGRKDNLETLKYLHRNGYPWDETTWRMAAKFNEDLLSYLEEHGCPRPSTSS